MKVFLPHVLSFRRLSGLRVMLQRRRFGHGKTGNLKLSVTACYGSVLHRASSWSEPWSSASLFFFCLSFLLQYLQIFLGSCVLVYLLFLIVLMIRAFVELRRLPYYSKFTAPFSFNVLMHFTENCAIGSTGGLRDRRTETYLIGQAATSSVLDILT